jgi:circadian clock protein KaiC
MKRERIKTGIPGLDEILNGGLLKGSTITLSGPTGCGKSTFGMQFLIEGALKYKEPGLFISLEESRDSTFFHMGGFNWDLEKLENNKLLVFLDYPIYEVDQLLSQNSAIMEIVNTMGIKRVVIDSILPLALHFGDDDERKRGFLKLRDNIRSWGTTTMIISEDTPATTQDVLPDTKYGLETFTEGWIHIYTMYSPKGSERTKAVEVLKMKGIQHSSKIYPAEMTDDGFVIMSKKKRSK